MSPLHTPHPPIHLAHIIPIHPSIQQVIEQIRTARELPALREHAAQLSRMCAAVRASLETHVRCVC